MNIALPILLLILGGLALWVLSESKLKWYTKSALISVFCVFTIIFWSSISSFLGWPAQEEDIPEAVKYEPRRVFPMQAARNPLYEELYGSWERR